MFEPQKFFIPIQTAPREPLFDVGFFQANQVERAIKERDDKIKRLEAEVAQLRKMNSVLNAPQPFVHVAQGDDTLLTYDDCLRDIESVYDYLNECRSTQMDLAKFIRDSCKPGKRRLIAVHFRVLNEYQYLTGESE